MPEVASRVPRVAFTRRVAKTKWGSRVVWQSVRDNLHHPQSFEVVADGDGVRLNGHSPLMDADDLALLYQIMGEASVAAEMIREGVDLETVRRRLAAVSKE